MKHYLLCAVIIGALTGCGGGETAETAEPTPVGAVIATATPNNTAPPTAARPTPTFVPIDEPPATPAPVGNEGESETMRWRFSDRAWTGGWRNRGESVYGGRTATWIYGTGTDFSMMETTFDLEIAVDGDARLVVEGMDDENEAKSRITIAVNGSLIYDGNNPLPNDDMPLETGTWAQEGFAFDASLLQVGRNTITIRNHSPGAVGRPPFFMLDYAELVLPAR